MSTWNHRIIKYTTNYGETVYQIAEVYYSEDGTAHSWSDPFLTGDTPEEVQENLECMQRGAMKPVLDMPNDGGPGFWDEVVEDETV